jgi:hypothetical protein
MFTDGQKIWMVKTRYAVSLYASKDEALDQMTRRDDLYSFVVTKLQREEA